MVLERNHVLFKKHVEDEDSMNLNSSYDHTIMILSDQSITDIIVCCTLGVASSILCVLCIKYDLFTKISTYCSKRKVVPVTTVMTIKPVVSINLVSYDNNECIM